MLQLYALRTAIVIIACFSALSSVIGLGSIFQAIFYPMIVIGIGLELAKYSAVSYVYTNYAVLDQKMKIGAWIFIPALVLFTSLGIYGYLGSAFSESNLARQKNQVVVESLTVQKTKLEGHLASINKQVAELPPNFVKGRVTLMESFNADKKHDQVELDAINLRLEKFQTESLDVQSHMGVIMFVASAINVPIEKAIAMLILCLTLCLDPFAIYLTMLSNKRSLKYVKPLVEEPKVELVVDPAPEPAVVADEVAPVIPEPDLDDINMQLADAVEAKDEVDTTVWINDISLLSAEPMTDEEFDNFLGMYKPAPTIEYNLTPVEQTVLRSALLRSVNIVVPQEPVPVLTALDDDVLDTPEYIEWMDNLVKVYDNAAEAVDQVPYVYIETEYEGELNGFDSLSEDDFALPHFGEEAIIEEPSNIVTAQDLIDRASGPDLSDEEVVSIVSAFEAPVEVVAAEVIVAVAAPIVVPESMPQPTGKSRFAAPIIVPEAMPHPNGKSRYTPQAVPQVMPQADNVPNLSSPTHADFGSAFPDKPGKGDVYLRTDFLPNRLFKFNGNKWILIDKAQIDVYAYEEKYIEHLITQIDSGRMDIEYLTDTEREQITEYLRRLDK